MCLPSVPVPSFLGLAGLGSASLWFSQLWLSDERQGIYLSLICAAELEGEAEGKMSSGSAERLLQTFLRRLVSPPV